MEMSLIFPQPISKVSLTWLGSHVWTLSESWDPEKIQCPSLWKVIVLQKKIKACIYLFSIRKYRDKKRGHDFLYILRWLRLTIIYIVLQLLNKQYLQSTTLLLPTLLVCILVKKIRSKSVLQRKKPIYLLYIVDNC